VSNSGARWPSDSSLLKQRVQDERRHEPAHLLAGDRRGQFLVRQRTAERLADQGDLLGRGEGLRAAERVRLAGVASPRQCDHGHLGQIGLVDRYPVDAGTLRPTLPVAPVTRNMLAPKVLA
jgi:hypothetical protein